MCRARVWAFTLVLFCWWEGNAVDPAPGFVSCPLRAARALGRECARDRPQACCPARLGAEHLVLWEKQPRSHSGAATRLQCVSAPRDGRSQPRRASMPGVSPGVRTAGENRLQASTDAIPEVSRQKYQEAALSGLIAVGQEIPDDWVPGDQFAFSADGRFRMGEVVVVATNDGNLRFGRVKSITSSGQEAPGSYTVSVSESRLGTRYKELAAEQVGKVLPLSQREIQRLGSSDLSSNGSKTTTIRNGGFFSSFRNLVDVDKTLGREETLPFQPMLSRRAMTPADSKMVPKPAGRVSTVMSGADSGDWGELDGWWRNEQDQTDTFEVLLQRPLGMELDEVDGEGIFVKALEDGGNAQRAGIRVGDRILVPGKEAARGSSWRDDLVSVLSAISDSTGNRMRYSSDDEALQRTKTILGKLNLILVQILKHEWPHNWKDFIPQIVESGKTNETLCGNNMQILKLLSEEVFEFSLKQLTSKKIDDLKERLTEEFQLIYQLCEFVMQNAKNVTTLQTTLQCFLRFLFWIPLYYVFETSLIDMLLHKFFPHEHFRCDSLQCLTEIAAIESKNVDPKYHPRIQKLYFDFITNLTNIVHADAIKRYHEEVDGGDEFVQRLTLFLTTIFKSHLPILETQELAGALIQGLQYLAQISKVDDDEIFKICVEYWHDLADDLYHKEHHHMMQARPAIAAPFASAVPNVPSARLQTYSPILVQVRRTLIDRMPKPEEVLVVEDENGCVVKEHLKDVEVVALHKMVRETLVFLTHLDHQQTEEIMIEKLGLQVHPTPGGPGWSRQGLSSLCWAIGSISGAMREDDEKKFLVHVIKDLLGLVEIVRGKDNKAVIASNIMYVVGQYPRFLRAHWKFLKTVVNKLFEFMHETHPGVQDMACETFLKICQRCKHQFVKHQPQENSPFIEQLLVGPHNTVCDIGTTIQDLEAHQQNMFYEAVGYIVAAETDPERRERIVQELFKLPNGRWQAKIERALQEPNLLLEQDTMREITKILQINVRVASSLGTPYISQLGVIYERMLQVYKMYSEQISQAVAGNALSAKTSGVRLMRAVKRETLRLIETTVDKSEEMHRIVAQVVPPLVDYVLTDYQNNHPETRDPEVLSVFAAIIRKAGDPITDQVPRILGAVFECTLAMITVNMEDYPEHRICFYTLLKEINQKCFRAFFQIPGEVFKVVIDSIIWAIKHHERNIADTGLTILLEMLRNLDGLADIAQQFYAQFLLSLLHETFSVLTDKEHEPGFKLQCEILQHLVSRVEQGLPAAPLFNAAEHPGMTDNRQFIRAHLLKMLSDGFSDRMTATQLQEFVAALFDPSKDKAAFATLMRDFLVSLREYNCDQWTQSSLALQLETQQKEAERQQAEAAKWQSVPGLMPVTKREEVEM